jgi:hypothetical protein
MASTPPGPFERCPPESADHRCSRVRRGLKGGTRRVAGGARARTDQTEFRNRPCRTSLTFCLGRLWSAAPVEGRGAAAARPLFVGIGGEVLVGQLLEVRAGAASWGGPVGRSSPWSTWVAARYTQHVGDQFGRQSTVRLGRPGRRFSCRVAAPVPPRRRAARPRGQVCRPPQSPLNRQRVAP